jgi:hypothetical protein
MAISFRRSATLRFAALMVINITEPDLLGDQIRVMADPLRGRPEQRSDVRPLKTCRTVRVR